MTISISLQATYEHIECAFSDQSDIVRIPKVEATAQLLITIEKLLASRKCTIHDLSYVAVNQGPGPFTTLRVLIATVNGISFATGIPLVGVDGLEAFAYDYRTSELPVFIMLNAFGGDVYYALVTKEQVQKGCTQVDDALSLCAQKVSGQIRLVGNGVLQYRNRIDLILGDRAQISEPVPSFCLLSSVAHLAQKVYAAEEKVHQLYPLYLKNVSYGARGG